jgi:hypothetical protein
METKERTSKVAQFLIVSASFVIVFVGIRAASSVLVPFILSIKRKKQDQDSMIPSILYRDASSKASHGATRLTL